MKKNLMYEVYKVLYRNTDDNHSMTLIQIQEYLHEIGCFQTDETVKRAIQSLKKDFGVDIINPTGRAAGYHIGGRQFELSELKLLIDAVNACNFIGRNQTINITKKLKDMTSIYAAADLERQVMGINVTKVDNKKFLYLVDELQRAIKYGHQIQFDYYAWSPEKELEKKRDEPYVVSPWTLIWADDRYYLYGYRNRNGEPLVESHFRVDKIANIEHLKLKRRGQEKFKKFDATSYVSKHLGMFSGKEYIIQVQTKAWLSGAFIDQFGKNILIERDKTDRDTIYITFEAIHSPNLLGWLIGLEDVKVIQPMVVKKAMQALLKKNIQYYD